MSKLELIGKQENGRDATLVFDPYLESFPRTVDQWIATARSRGLVFSEDRTREEGVILGQYSSVCGMVEFKSTIDEYSEAFEKRKRIVENLIDDSDAAHVDMVVSLHKHNQNLSIEEHRNNEYVVSVSFDNPRDAYEYVAVALLDDMSFETTDPDAFMNMLKFMDVEAWVESQTERNLYVINWADKYWVLQVN